MSFLFSSRRDDYRQINHGSTGKGRMNERVTGRGREREREREGGERVLRRVKNMKIKKREREREILFT